MVILNIKFANRTEHAVFQTRWAAEMRADEWMNKDPRIQSIAVVERGITKVTYIRRG